MTNDQPPHLSTAIVIASSTSVRGIFFGMGLTLYCVCVQVLFGNFNKCRQPRGQTVFSFVYYLLIMSCSLMSLATSTNAVIEAFTWHEDNIQAYIASITLRGGDSSVNSVWTCIRLVNMYYLDWILLCNCCRWSTSLGIASCSRWAHSKLWLCR
jgi:hypothetical protein